MGYQLNLCTLQYDFNFLHVIYQWLLVPTTVKNLKFWYVKTCMYMLFFDSSFCTLPGKNFEHWKAANKISESTKVETGVGKIVQKRS